MAGLAAAWLAAGWTPTARALDGPGAALAGEAPYVEGQVLAQFRADVSAEGVETLAARLGLVVLKPLGGGRYLLRIVDGSPVPAVVARLQALPAVLSAAPNHLTPRPRVEGSARPLVPPGR